MSTEKLQQTKDLLVAKLVQALQSCKPENGFSRVVQEHHTSLCFVNGLWALADNYNGAELVIQHEAVEAHAVMNDTSVFQLNELMRYEKTIALLIQKGDLTKASVERPPHRHAFKHSQRQPAAAANDANRQLGKPLQPVRF